MAATDWSGAEFAGTLPSSCQRQWLELKGAFDSIDDLPRAGCGLVLTATDSNIPPLLRRRITGMPSLLPLAAAQPRRYPGLLESAADGAGARWDVLFAFPETVITSDDGSFLSALDAAWQHDRVAHHDHDLPFRGGWLLYLGYELVAQIEPCLELPNADASLPDALAIRCPAAILIDRRENCTWLIAEPGREDLLDAMVADLASNTLVSNVLPALVEIVEDAPGAYLDGVARIHDYLRSGDIFQVNLSRAWHARYAGKVEPTALYAALRLANPAPFAALLQWKDCSILSSSPERLVSVAGRKVQTRPIAGTRSRFAGDDDQTRRAELVGHPKERAEHVMLIDLERNDLGRVAVPGSVVVDELMTVESYAHVHHIVSNVSAQLRDDVTPGAVISAVFPGGTITGCPKIRCMQIIAELEGIGRGAYTGSIGYLNRDGDMDLNILIRTLVASGDRVDFRAGAGIVIDSDATRELAETRAKARGLLNALGEVDAQRRRVKAIAKAGVGMEE